MTCFFLMFAPRSQVSGFFLGDLAGVQVSCCVFASLDAHLGDRRSTPLMDDYWSEGA